MNSSRSRLRRRRSAAYAHALIALSALLLACSAAGTSRPVTYGCDDPQEVTPTVSGTIDVNVAAASSNAGVSLAAEFQLSCDDFDITDTIQLQSVTLADATSGATLATLNVAFPPSFDPVLTCSHDATIPATEAQADLADDGTSNSALIPLCGTSLVLNATIVRSGCSGATTAETSSSPIQLQCTGVICGGQACDTNESCCTCQGKTTCLPGSCVSFGCT